MIATQSEQALNPKPQPSSRAPSPVPSAVYGSALESSQTTSARRSSVSTEVSTDTYDEKQPVHQKSYTSLISGKKGRKTSNRRESDATNTDDNNGSEASFSTTAATESTGALPRLLANDKRNHDFHTLFRSVPDGERLIDDYGCALQKEILLQGRVYISEHHLCFNANIFGWITNLVIAFADIEDIEKRSTAIFIPNAILISTCSSKHFLASFLSRDQAFDQMVEVWKASRASSTIEVHHDKLKDDASSYSDNESDISSSSGYSYSDDGDEEDEEDDTVNPTSVNTNQIQDKALLKDRQSSLASLPLPKHMSSAEDAARRRAVSEAGPRPNVQEYIKKSESATTGSSTVNASTTNISNVTNSVENADTPSSQLQIKEKTDCECHKNASHFPTVVMDNKYDTTIETMYNLLYNSSFMNKFLCDIEKSTDVCIGQWNKNAEGEAPYSRESSYIKYLGGSIGPKSTKCYLKEEIHHLDTSDYVTQLTVTQTPDVPSGGSFSVKTRTCISWCGQNQVRVLVTVLVDFTKSSWLKSTIEKASIDGQQNFYKSLDAAVRKYLDQHAGTTNKPTKKKGGKRRHHKHRSEKQITEPTPEPPKNHIVIEVLSSVLNWLVERITSLNTSQLTAICMGMMVLTNMYIASKMAGVDKQLSQLGYQQQQQHHQHRRGYSFVQDERDDNSLWKLLSKLDPDARKEDLNFVQHRRQPLPSTVRYQNHNSNHESEGSSEYDENLEFSQVAKEKLDKQMMELEKMIQKAGQSMEQVTHVVQNQRKRILNPEWK